MNIYTPTPTSQLARVDSKLKTGAPCKGEPFCVREYDNVEYKCEVDDHVAEWASVFEVMCHANGSFVEPTVWPICRPSVKCNNTVPAAPFYTNLVTVSTPPIKEYDMVEYTCYDETLKLINNSKVSKAFYRPGSISRSLKVSVGVASYWDPRSVVCYQVFVTAFQVTL